ncbi:MAG: ferredoxin [Gammaproteobacteria bacterium]|nr:MAG: ferredoxin [Gammaproteobacteria bacterium]
MGCFYKKHLVEIDKTNESFICKQAQHILSGMAAMGKKGIPSGCHGGGCGVCKVHILDGKVKTKSMSREHISDEEIKLGIVLACRAYPESRIKLKVIGKISKNVLKTITKKKYGFV